ncbi:hypothetical protein ACFLW4_01835 [Chloroflexota bacterium]
MTQKEKQAEERNPNSDRSKRNVKLANDIDGKITSLGMKRNPGIGAHLSDIAITLEEFNELLEEFLAADVKDHEAIGDVLIGINVHVLEHIYYHIKHLKRPLERIIEFCYEDTNDDSD